MSYTPEQTAVLKKIASPDQISPFFKACIYGEQGCGKTVLAAHAPAPLIVECEREGTLSLLNHPNLKGKYQILRVSSAQEVLELVDAAMDGALPDVETFVIDTASELASRNLDEILDAEIARPGSNRNDPLDPFQRDYKRNTNAMRRLLIKLMDLPKHVILTAHHTTDETKDDKGNVTSRLIRPDFSPKLEKTVRSLCSVIGYMSKDETKKGDGKVEITRTLRVSGNRRIYAKSRVGGLPVVMENPSMDTLFKAYQKMLSNNGDKGV
jgi:phage nucleotide-binding protein